MEGLSDPKERASIRRAPRSGPPRAAVRPEPAGGTQTPELAPATRMRTYAIPGNPHRRCQPHVNGAIIAAPRTNMVQTALNLPANYLIWYDHGLAWTLQYQATSPASHISPLWTRRRALPLSRSRYDTQRRTETHKRKTGEIRGPALHRHARQGAARDHSGAARG